MSKSNLDQAPGERPERIAKVLARAGVCSRRDAERWIAEGRVSVDGACADHAGGDGHRGNDIRVDGKPLPAPERPRLWRYHKPAGLVTSHRDEKGRPTVFDALPKDLPRLISVGRLDLNSEGLLLLTNDGALARRLELPSTGWLRRYKVRVHGEVEPERLAALEKGITIDGVVLRPDPRQPRTPSRAAMPGSRWRCAREKTARCAGCSSISGLQVTRLIRLSYGPFQLGNLPRGAVEEVPRKV